MPGRHVRIGDLDIHFAHRPGRGPRPFPLLLLHGWPSSFVEVPTGVALFPKEVMRPPRSAVERKYRLMRWTEMSRGGHFPALEASDDLASELRAFFGGLRPAPG